MENLIVSNFLFAVQLILPAMFLLDPDNYRKRSLKKNYLNVLLCYLILLLFAAFNPLNHTINHGMYGLVLHSIFWILLLFYLNYQHVIRINNYTIFFLAFCVLELIIGILQYNSANNALLNYGNHIDSVIDNPAAMVGDSIRASGTFSYIAGFTSFNVFTLFLTCYYIKLKPAAPITFLLLFAGLYCSFLSGSRAAVILFVLTVLVFITTEVLIWEILQKSARLILIPGFCWLINYLAQDPLAIQSGFVKSYYNFMLRFDENRDEGISRLSDDFTAPFTQKFKYALSGIGLGATYQGANISYGLNPLLVGIPFEGELFRLLIEGGYGILLIRFALLGYVLSGLRFSWSFKFYLFIMLGLYSSLAFNCYSSIFTACGLILLNHAYSDTLSSDYEKT